MDLTFSPKPQTPISSVSLSSSSQFFLPISIRKEFLGSAIHPRSLGLRSRTRSRSSGSRCRSPRCLFEDSLLENSTLAVAAAVATLAAIQVIYLNYSRQRREAEDVPDQELPDNSDGLCKEGTDILKKEAVASQFLCSESFYSEDLRHEKIGAVEGAHRYACVKRDYASDSKDDQILKFDAVVLGCEEKITDDSEPDDKLPAFMATDGATVKTNGSEGFNVSSVIFHEVDALEEDQFVANMPELLHVEQEEPVPTVSYMKHSIPIFNSFAIPLKKEREIHPENHLEKIDTDGSESIGSGYHKPLRKFAKEVSACNEAEHPEVRSITFKNLSAEPLHVTLQDNNIYCPQLWSGLKGADILGKVSLLSAEDLKAREARACLKEGPMGKEKKLVEVHGHRGAMGRTSKHKNDNIDLIGFSQPNGNLVKKEDDSLAYLKAYNRLLRDARLKDCIDLLESMDKKGLLNMDKVHHASFLNACKNQKAVEEAFRFVKLIRNPTMSTFNMLLSVCASSRHFDGAFQVMLLLKEAGLKPDCRLYTTLISTCAKSGKVDAMFEVFHEMVNAGVEPNVNTYGALIDGCGRAGQVAKAFGAYGIMRSKKVQPDRAIFNSLITACGESGAVDRAFDVLAEMMMEPKPIDPDHVTVGALLKTCTQAGQVDRAREVYKMLHQYNIKGTTEVYTIAVKSCSQAGDLDFAVSIYNDMKRNGVQPDEMFLSTLIDVAGHAENVDAAFEILREARTEGIQLGHISYSSLMGACCNARNWQKALELYEEIKAIQMIPTVSMLNALITSLCDGHQIMKSVEVLDEMKKSGVQPNVITYSLLIVACEKNGEAELGISLLTQAKKDGILPNLIMCRCLTGLCLRSFEEACSLGEPVISFNSGKPQIDNKWTSLAIMIYRETISAGVIPTVEVFSQVLGCLQFPRDSSLRKRFVENLGFNFDASKFSNTSSLLDGFGEYDSRCFSVLEEAASLGLVPHVSFKENPIVVDARKLLIHTVEVYLLTILKGLKHRLAAGARLPNITILLPVEKTQIKSANGERTVSVVGRVGQAVCSLLRRLGLPYQGDESYGKIRIYGLTLRRWFKPKLMSSSSAGRIKMIPTQTRLAKGISDQQRSIRSSNNLSVE